MDFPTIEDREQKRWDLLPNVTPSKSKTEITIDAVLDARSKEECSISIRGALEQDTIRKFTQKGYTVKAIGYPSEKCNCWGNCFCIGTRSTTISWIKD